MSTLLEKNILVNFHYTLITPLAKEKNIKYNNLVPTDFGAWLSLVERCVRDAEVACSNHVAPISILSIDGVFHVI